MKSAGKFYGIGLGPGDPELLTRKAARILREVDCIFVPGNTTGRPGLAATIIASLDLGRAKLRPVSLCMSRARDSALGSYDRAAEEIHAQLERGQSAAWVTEGDPLFFSTFGHVLTALRRRDPDVAIEIVPGITSVQAAAACVRVPVAQLDERVAVIPGAYGLDHLPQLVEEFATIFLLKVHTVFDQLLDKLACLPRPLQAFYIENLGRPEQRVVSELTSLRGARLPYFSLVMIRRQP
jgi:precorrin-2/cobalt-factor-2 C20-methyltransferase